MAEFGKMVKQHTTLKQYIGSKLYKKMLNLFKQKAQTAQFGKFIQELDFDIICQDWHHILKTHVNNGTKESIKNTFLFFSKSVHYEDTPTQTAECRSIKRREERINKINVNDDTKYDEKENHYDDKNLWKLKQYHIQSQLDMAHSYLVHSNYKLFIQRYVSQHADDNIDYNSENIKDTDSVQN
eukprot:5357_1